MDIKINSLKEIEMFQGKTLGSGYISEVKLGRHIPTNTPVAIKMVI